MLSDPWRLVLPRGHRLAVVVRPLTRDNQPTRDVYAVTRPALSATTTAVRSILAALTASGHRQHAATSAQS